MGPTAGGTVEHLKYALRSHLESVTTCCWANSQFSIGTLSGYDLYIRLVEIAESTFTSERSQLEIAAGIKNLGPILGAPQAKFSNKNDARIEIWELRSNFRRRRRNFLKMHL